MAPRILMTSRKSAWGLTVSLIVLLCFPFMCSEGPGSSHIRPFPNQSNHG